MVERIKNRKGFTIIEIMVVIALIGILAAVLVPKFTGIKDRARDAGMLTNAKMVEAYVASEIDSWNSTNAIGSDPGASDMIAAIRSYFDDNNLVNPYTGVEGANIVVEEDSNATFSAGEAGADIADAGIIYVTINEASPVEVRIIGFDRAGAPMVNTQRIITQ